MARFADFRGVTCRLQLLLDAALVGDVAADPLDLDIVAVDRQCVELLEHEPARAPGRQQAEFERLRRRCVGRRPIPALDDHRREGRTKDVVGIDAERPAVGPVDEGQPTIGIGTADDVALAIEQVPVARLVVAQLPFQVLEPLEARIVAVGDGGIQAGLTLLVADRQGGDALGDARPLKQAGKAPEHDRTIAHGEPRLAVTRLATPPALDLRLVWHGLSVGRWQSLVVLGVTAGHRTHTPGMTPFGHDPNTWALMKDYALGLK